MRRLRDAFRRPLEAHEPADERVVPGVRGVRIGLREYLVETMFGLRKWRLRDFHPDLPKPRRADRNEEGGNRFDPSREVVQPLADDIASGKALDLHDSMIAAVSGR